MYSSDMGRAGWSRAAVFCACMAVPLAAACSSDSACVEVSLDCNALYAPTFDNVFSMTLEAKCGIDGPCHNSTRRAGGIVYEDADQAHDLLLQSRVVPGDPGCSVLVQRLESTGGRVMPPGAPLSEQERCSIRQWIANGAER